MAMVVSIKGRAKKAAKTQARLPGNITGPVVSWDAARLREPEDVLSALKRVRVLLSKLNHFEGNIHIDSKPDEDMAIRFALLDAARTEIEEMVEEAR